MDRRDIVLYVGLLILFTIGLFTWKIIPPPWDRKGFDYYWKNTRDWKK